MFRDLTPCSPWTDRLYFWLRFRKMHGRSPRSGDAATFSDYLYDMKINGSLLDPLRQLVSDKEYIKQYTNGIVGEQHTLKTLQVLSSPTQIDKFSLPRVPCVIKPTHLSGEIFICSEHNQKPDTALMKKWLRTNYYVRKRELNYRYLQPKIIVEEFFSVDGKTAPRDYKIFCFHGIPRFVQVDIDRFANHERNYYDTQWNKLDFSCKRPTSKRIVPKPRSLATMLDVAAKLSWAFSFVRVDLYAIGEQVKVGELTNCPESGDFPFEPSAADEAIGRMCLGHHSSPCQQEYLANVPIGHPPTRRHQRAGLR